MFRGFELASTHGEHPIASNEAAAARVPAVAVDRHVVEDLVGELAECGWLAVDDPRALLAAVDARKHRLKHVPVSWVVHGVDCGREIRRRMKRRRLRRVQGDGEEGDEREAHFLQQNKKIKNYSFKNSFKNLLDELQAV